MGRNKNDPATTGAAAWENADEEDRQRVRDEGVAAWEEASEEVKERVSLVYKSSFEVCYSSDHVMKLFWMIRKALNILIK